MRLGGQAPKNMINKWHNVKDACKLASTKETANIIMLPATTYSKRAAKNTQSMLNDINSVLVILQTSTLHLYKCREIQEVHMVTAEEGKLALANPCYQNSFGKVYIFSQSSKRPDKTFTNAVCKMQKRQVYTLTRDEKGAISKWLEKPATTQNEAPANVSLAACLS
jgi:hypothetical protein